MHCIAYLYAGFFFDRENMEAVREIIRRKTWQSYHKNDDEASIS